MEPTPLHWRVKDISGHRFCRLVVLSPAGKAGASRSQRWHCVCDCGERLAVVGRDLRNGTTRSCGCLSRETSRDVGYSSKTHGMTGTSIYAIWRGMLARCNNPNEPSYRHYGGRGIRVCDRWLEFDAFLADMGDRPATLSLDRRDNNGNYEPGNCRWATMTQQGRNRRTNNLIEFMGERLCLSEWAERLNMPVPTLEARFRRGWSIEDALCKPVMKEFSRVA